MFQKIVTSKKYWWGVLKLGFGFIVLFSMVMHFMDYKGIDLETFHQEQLAEGRWVRYIISRLIGGIIYGLFMSYGLTLRKITDQKK